MRHIFVLVVLTAQVLILTGCERSRQRSEKPTSELSELPTPDSCSAEVASTVVPLEHQALLMAYPDVIKNIEDNKVILFTGEEIVYDDGKEKNHNERLDNCDVEDMFYQTYSVTDSVPPYLFDPGRTRSDKLFKALYGSTAAEVTRNLVTVEWFGGNVRFTAVNGAADSLRAVAKELANNTHLEPFLKSSGTFYWRPVRGADRLSAHSYGIAFDIGVAKSDYWLWKNGNRNDELARVTYTNRIPLELVKIFEKHGFIWGGAWYHFDTMHFEFRPELIKYAQLQNR